jgi:hypothetical protein
MMTTKRTDEYMIFYLDYLRRTCQYFNYIQVNIFIEYEGKHIYYYSIFFPKEKSKRL